MTTILTSRPDVARSLEADAEELRRALGELVRVIQFRDRDRACCYGVSVSQCYALKAVADGGPLTVNELAAHLYLDKSTASRVARGLVRHGLLQRRRDPSDARSVKLTLTPRGRALHERILNDLDLEYASLLRGFDPEVRSAVTELTARVTRALAARVEASGGSCCAIESAEPVT